MNTPSRFLLTAALLALAACGNKGPLVHPSAPADTAVPAASPPASDPTDSEPATEQAPPADADPGGAVPPQPPADGDG